MMLRRPVGIVVAVLLGCAALGVSTGTASAAPTPWRFTTISVTKTVADGTDADLWAPCPDGYFPVTGGIESDGKQFQLLYQQQDPQNGWFTTSIHAIAGGQYTMHADCLDDNAVGFVDQPSHTFAADSNGVAGGVVECPADQQVIGGSAYWTKAGEREVDYNSPYGNPTGGNWWFAKGRSSVAGNALVVTAECVLKSDMASARLYEGVETSGSDGRVSSLTGCPSDMRILTGGSYTLYALGAYPLAGRVLDAYPESPRLWNTTAAGFPSTVHEDLITDLWCVPASVPTVQITAKPPAVSNLATVRFGYSAFDPAGYPLTVLCGLDSGTPGPCNTPGPGLFVTYLGLSDGSHTFTVIASNPDGQAALASYTWTQDRTGPTITFTHHPATLSNSRSAAFAFSVSDVHPGSAHPTCQLDSAAVGPCTTVTSASYAGLADGQHTLVVRAVDAAGNTGAATYTWRIDTAAPVVTLTQPAGPVALAGATTVAWTGADKAGGSGVSHYQVREQSAGPTGGFSAWSTPTAWAALSSSTTHLTSAVPVGKTVCFSVRAIDRSGNVSPWTAARCTAAPIDDRSLTPATTGWTRHTVGGYYRGSYTAATRSGAAVVSAGATFDRVGLVATHCPTCGTVAVYDGTTLLGTVNLHAVTRTLQVLTTFQVRPLHTARVKLVVRSSGKPVQIDGLVLSRK